MAGRLDSIERGLTLVLEGVDCSGGQFGLVEGLARDAMGAAVLVLVAVDGDGLLTARTHAACEFLARIGGSLPQAVPEANLVAGAHNRVLVLGTDAGAGSLDLLCRLPLPGLEVCRLESFRIAGSERLAVRWLDADGGNRSAATPAARAPDFEVPNRCRLAWDELRQLCERIDPGVAFDGDRFSRRATWQGRLLGRIEIDAGELCGFDVHGERHAMRGSAEVRRFVDRLLRRYSYLAGLESACDGERRAPAAGADEVAADPSPAAGNKGSRTGRGGNLRSTLSTRLSDEEYSALGAPTSEAAGSAAGSSDALGAEGAEPHNVADDIARIVSAKSGPWHAQRRTE
jgi:hypothetical protein